MENCKFCNAELPEGSTVCPSCGKENAQPKARLSAGKTVFAIASFIAVVVLAAAVVLNSGNPIVSDDTLVAMSEEAAPETEEVLPEATIPADGNPDDATCKGSYTADDETVIAARDTVIATAGDLELTVGQFQVFYWMEVRNFLSQYGAYASYFGLDYQQSLDTQVCGVMETPMTWQQYFVESALQAWGSYSAMSAEAEANGFTLTDAQVETLNTIADDLEASAVANGFESAVDMITKSLGAGADVESYKNFMELYYKANGYYTTLAGSIHPTAEDLEAFFQEHEEGYAQSGITKDTKTVDVRHILIYPEGADGTNIFTDEFSDEAWAAGEAAAQALLEEWAAGEKTEESFAALANEHSQDPGSNTNGGLYTGVTEGEMVAAFNDWCFDAERQVGDTGVVKTEYGYHVMFFSGSETVWQQYVESDYVSETANNMVVEVESKYPMNVKYDTILLADVQMQ